MEFNATFLATIISFITFVLLMKAILYDPMYKIVQERNSYFEENDKITNENKLKVQELTDKKNELVENARKDAKQQYVEAISKINEQKRQKIEDAQNQIVQELEADREALKNVSNTTKDALKYKMTDLANDIVEKILGYRPNIQSFDENAVNNILYH